MMNSYLADRIQDISDALPSASKESLEDIETSLDELLVEVRRRLDMQRADAKTVRLGHAELRSVSHT
jgi:hypothetical protein